MINTKIQEFKAQAYFNKKFIEIDSNDLIGKWSILFFYPSDFAFVCPTELEDLADNYEAFEKINAQIYTISTDSHFAHKAWHDSSAAIGKITFPMISDRTGSIAQSFNVLGSDHSASRATFLVDPNGVIQYMEMSSKGVGRSAITLIEKIEAAQYQRKNPGEFCPAKWAKNRTAVTKDINNLGK